MVGGEGEPRSLLGRGWGILREEEGRGGVRQTVVSSQKAVTAGGGGRVSRRAGTGNGGSELRRVRGGGGLARENVEASAGRSPWRPPPREGKTGA